MRLVLSCSPHISAMTPSKNQHAMSKWKIELTDPGAALLRPPIFPAEASIRFNLSMIDDLLWILA